MVTIFSSIWYAMRPFEKQHLAERLGTSTNYLRHVAHGRKRASAKRAIEIADELTAMGYRGVRKSWVRPDLFYKE